MRTLRTAYRDGFAAFHKTWSLALVLDPSQTPVACDGVAASGGASLFKGVHIGLVYRVVRHSENDDAIQ